MQPIARSLRHPGGVTELLVGTSSTPWIVAHLGGWVEGRRLFVVTSKTVWELHGEALAGLERQAAGWHVLTVADGEPAKSLATATRLWKGMLEAGGKRDSRLVAFGGGTVGDVGGFAAACFLRGIEYAQVPTTLLAQVDAAVGGKTAINLPEAKNSVGALHHPSLVLSEPRFLATLPARELRSGLVEVVKMAAMLDAEEFGRLEGRLAGLPEASARRWVPVVAAAQRMKAEVVERDPAEADERRLLNFGHTLGHAIEAALGYRRILHGEAVAHGILFALGLARRRGLADDEAARIEAAVRELAPPPLPALEPERLLHYLRRDKKAREEGLAFALPVAIGHGRTVRIEAAEVARELRDFLAKAPDGC